MRLQGGCEFRSEAFISRLLISRRDGIGVCVWLVFHLGKNYREEHPNKALIYVDSTERKTEEGLFGWSG